jgi:ABC-type phosphate transport system permease subunit
VKIGGRVDILMYLRAIPMLFTKPSIIAMPALAGVIAWGVAELTPLMTDPLGGAGAGIFSSIVQIIYLYAFGVAVIQASNAWRGRKATFDEAWEEGKRKSGGILMAAIGFLFMIWVAAFIGSMLGTILGIFLELIAAFFLIYTIPAAAIGGLPGQLPLSGSINAVKANVFGAAVLAIVFVAIWIILPNYIAILPFGGNFAVNNLIIAGIHALLLGYLAFPFAKQYDDVAFSRFW